MSDDDPEILRPVLARFAAGWGASVDCGEGWWPIIAQLDRDIAAIESDYEVHQIKEKFARAPVLLRGRHRQRCANR